MLLDNACGGKGQQIRLFGDEPVGNSSCLAWVDAAIVIKLGGGPFVVERMETTR